MTETIIPEHPEFFKGIALFTPGGDVIYCIDSSKQGRWHLHLCAALQEYFGLSEPPHFLVSGYTATVDRWLDPRTQEVKIFAEAYPPVLRYQALLNLIFQLDDVVWQPTPWPDDFFSPMVLGNYHQQFPSLWENHNFIFRCDLAENFMESSDKEIQVKSMGSSFSQTQPNQEYVFHIFVSGTNSENQKTLKILFELLEECFGINYRLKVIDIYRHPELTERHQIFATPTLLKLWPLPTRRIVGNLEKTDKIKEFLLSFK